MNVLMHPGKRMLRSYMFSIFISLLAAHNAFERMAQRMNVHLDMRPIANLSSPTRLGT
jgi:hypothetical protein